MGSSSDEVDYNNPPAIQGPPVTQLQPAQPPPNYPQFLPGQAGATATGLTQQQMNDIAAFDQAQRASLTAPPQAATPPGDSDQVLRDLLARLLAERMGGPPGGARRYGGGSSQGAGYTTSGSGARSSANYGGSGLI